MSARRLAALALANHKSTKNALADVESTPVQLAVGYFANQDFVQKALESIYQTMNLDGGTTFWKKQVRKLFKKKDGDKVKGTATGKGGATKEQDESATDDQESSDEDGKGSDEGSDQSDGESDALIEDNEKVEKPPKSRPAKKPKLEKAKPVRNEENDNPKPAKSKKNKKAAESTAVDDFFITAEGTSYLSTAVVKEEPKVKKEGGEARAKPQHEKRNQPFDKVAPNNRGNGKFEAKPSFKRPYEEVAEPKKEIDPNLHPSWLAKQKQKPIIAGFQGKKITFD